MRVAALAAALAALMFAGDAQAGEDGVPTTTGVAPAEDAPAAEDIDPTTTAAAPAADAAAAAPPPAAVAPVEEDNSQDVADVLPPGSLTASPPGAFGTQQWYDPNIPGQRWWEHKAYKFGDICVPESIAGSSIKREEGWFDGHCLAMLETFESGQPCSHGLMASVADDDITGFSTLVDLDPTDNLYFNEEGSAAKEKIESGLLGAPTQLAKERWVNRMLTQYTMGYPLDLGPLDVSHADVNGDTFEDIIGTTEGDNFKLGHVSVYLHENRNMGQKTAGELLFPELATTPADDVAAKIGRGRYLKAPIDVDNLNPRPAKIAAADFDNDGDMDLVVAYQNSIWWYANDAGDGKDWIREELQGSVAYPTDVITRDLEKDGDWDILAAFKDLGLIVVYTNQGAAPPEEIKAGEEQTLEAKAAGAKPQGEAVDVNLKRSVFDYAVENDEGYRVIGQVQEPSVVRIADVDLDNHWDVLTASVTDKAGLTPGFFDAYQGGSLWWYRNGGRLDKSGEVMSWSLKKFIMTINHPTVMEVLDINVDGLTDVISLAEDGSVYYCLNFIPTLGKWGSPRVFSPIDRFTGALNPEFQYVHSLTAGDSNRDGYSDIFVVADNAPFKETGKGPYWQKSMHGWAMEYINLGPDQVHDEKNDPEEMQVQHFDYFKVVGQFGGRIKRVNSAVMNCKHCPYGTYLKAGSRIMCVDCPAGTYQSQDGALNENSCHPCAAGRYSDAGSEFCKFCPCGTYSAVAGAPYCHSCPAGRFSVLTNQTNSRVCEECPAGRFSGPGACGCDECPRGTYQDELGQRQCKACVSGKFNGFTGSKTVHDCKACAPGKFVGSAAAEECTSCPCGTFNLQQGSTDISACSDCPARTYSRAGSARCTKCAGGTYNAEPRACGCSICEAGTASAGADVDCSDCAPGKYAERGSATCEDCPAGTFNELTNGESQNICLRCDVGYYSHVGAGVCAMCRAGKYSDTTGAGPDCTSCAAGKYLLATGATSADLCQHCPPGSWSADGSFSCKVCPADSYLHNVEDGSLQCSPCALGLKSHRGSTKCYPPDELPELESALSLSADTTVGFGYALIVGAIMVAALGLTYFGMMCYTRVKTPSSHRRMHKIDLNVG